MAYSLCPALRYPLGAWEFHSAPAQLIQSSPTKPIRVFHSVTNHDLGTTGNTPYAACDLDLETRSEKVVMSTVGCFEAPGICKGTPAEGKWMFHNTLDPQHSNWDVANNRTAVALRDKGYETRFAFALSACHCDSAVFKQDLPSTLVWAWRGWGR